MNSRSILPGFRPVRHDRLLHDILTVEDGTSGRGSKNVSGADPADGIAAG